MLHYVYGDSSRIFLNTAIGCEARCEYCYLPQLGINGVPQYEKAENVLEKLQSLEYFISGEHGTVVSIGCYSECWSPQNRPETIKLISAIAGMGNYIQLATKKTIEKQDILLLDTLATYDNQIGIYLSVPTITHSDRMEKGTDCISKRLSPLEMKYQTKRLYYVLYIKPVLQGITICDCNIYKTFMEKYNIYAVVGTLFTRDAYNRSDVLVGEGNFKEITGNDVDYLNDELSFSDKVFTHSTEVIEYIRERKALGK